MYYKMTNTSCEKYKQLRAFREKEIEIEKENRKAIEKIVRHPFDKFVGHSGQNSFDRVTRWRGFVFTDTKNIDERIWKTDKEFPDAYFPNRRYKEGKAMYERINALQKSSFFKFMELLGIEFIGRFSWPYIFISGDVLLFYLDDKFEPTDENFIEITKKEFDATRESYPE